MTLFSGFAGSAKVPPHAGSDLPGRVARPVTERSRLPAGGVPTWQPAFAHCGARIASSVSGRTAVTIFGRTFSLNIGHPQREAEKLVEGAARDVGVADRRLERIEIARVARDEARLE